jgi:hypothetical protein
MDDTNQLPYFDVKFCPHLEMIGKNIYTKLLNMAALATEDKRPIVSFFRLPAWLNSVPSATVLKLHGFLFDFERLLYLYDPLLQSPV